MKTRVEILDELYRSGWVEMDARKFLGAADRIYADDIIAELWLIICELPARLVEEIYGGCGEECLRRYISGLIKNQLRSTNSRIYKKYTMHVYRNKPTETVSWADEDKIIM